MLAYSELITIINCKSFTSLSLNRKIEFLIKKRSDNFKIDLREVGCGSSNYFKMNFSKPLFKLVTR